MVDLTNDASWINKNVQVVTNYLTKEFENFAIGYHADRPLTHTFTVNNEKKLFKLVIGWPTLADRTFTSERVNRLLTGRCARNATPRRERLPLERLPSLNVRWLPLTRRQF